MSTVETSWVGALICAGGIAGSPLFRFLSDRFGTKKCIMFLVLPQYIFWLTVMFATDVYHLYIARFTAGITGGGIFCAFPLYIAGIAEPNVRGTLGSILLLSYYLGILLSYVLGMFVEYKIFPLIGISLPTIFFIIFYFFPETPQYLLKQDRKEDALKSLQFYRGVDRKTSTTPNSIDEEFKRMQASNTSQNEHPTVHLNDFGG